MKVYYNNNLKEFSRKLRKESTLGEVLLWQQLKGRKIFDLQFTRQKPIGNYIVDLFCPKLNLAIEIDGITHDFKHDEDIKRQNEIEKLGIKVIRFTEKEVRNNLEGVVEYIKNWIIENKKGTGQEETTP